MKEQFAGKKRTVSQTNLHQDGDTAVLGPEPFLVLGTGPEGFVGSFICCAKTVFLFGGMAEEQLRK